MPPSGPFCPFPRDFLWDSNHYYDERGELHKYWDEAKLNEHLERITSRQWYEEMKLRVEFHLKGFMSTEKALKHYEGRPKPPWLIKQILDERIEAFRVEKMQAERRHKNPKGKGAGRPKQTGPTIDQRTQDIQCQHAMELLLTAEVSQTAAAGRIGKIMHVHLSPQAVIDAWKREKNRPPRPVGGAGGVLRFDPQERLVRFDPPE